MPGLGGYLPRAGTNDLMKKGLRPSLESFLSVEAYAGTNDLMKKGLRLGGRARDNSVPPAPEQMT